jgi:hypothetical protein
LPAERALHHLAFNKRRRSLEQIQL